MLLLQAFFFLLLLLLLLPFLVSGATVVQKSRKGALKLKAERRKIASMGKGNKNKDRWKDLLQKILK